MDRRELLFIGSTLVSIFMPMMIVFVLSGKQWKAAKEKAGARRMAEHRMNARLLRLDI